MTPATRIALLAFTLSPLLLAPSPGRTGGCAADAFEADPKTFCLESRSWECVRAAERGEIEAAEVQACVDDLVDRCESAQWPFDCRPFPLARETDACLEALSFEENVSIPLADLPECQLCRGDR